MFLVAWFVVALATATLISWFLRGPGAISIIDVIVGTVFGMAGAALLRVAVFNHTYSSHMFSILMFDYIAALSAVEFCTLLPFTGRNQPVPVPLPPRGPVQTGPDPQNTKAY